MMEKIKIGFLCILLTVGMSLDSLWLSPNKVTKNLENVESNTDTLKQEKMENSKEENNEIPETPLEEQKDNSEKPDENKPPIDKLNPETTPVETPTNPELPKEEPITPSTTAEQKNDVFRKQLETKYGITIFYGNELANYYPRGYKPVTMTDTAEIESYLSQLNLTLSQYPQGFFKDFKNFDMPLTIYLIKSVPNDAFAGLTDKEFYTKIIITTTTSGLFHYVLNHELMHYIDAYLEIRMYNDTPNSPYIEFESLNPIGYQYGSFIEEYNYNMLSKPKGAYFTSSYGQTNVLEDRAKVFEFMMRAYPPPGCFEQGEVIRKKAEVIAKQIKQYVPSAKGNNYWDILLSKS